MSIQTIEANEVSGPLFDDLKEDAKSLQKALKVFDPEAAKKTKLSECLEICVQTLGHDSWFAYRSRMSIARHLRFADMFANSGAVIDFFLDALSKVAAVENGDRSMMAYKLSTAATYDQLKPEKHDALAIMWRCSPLVAKRFDPTKGALPPNNVAAALSTTHAPSIVDTIKRITNDFRYGYSKLDWLKSTILKNMRSGKHDWLLGYKRHSSDPLWISQEKARHHFVYAMPPGSYRVEAQISFAASAIFAGSGCCIIDTSGYPFIQDDVCKIAKLCGREDDVVAVDFNKRPGGKGGKDNVGFDLFGDLTKEDALNFIKATLPDDVAWDDEIENFLGLVLETLKLKMRVEKHGRFSVFQFVTRIYFWEIWDFAHIKQAAWYEGTEEEKSSIVRVQNELKKYFKTLPGYEEILKNYLEGKSIYDTNEASRIHDSKFKKLAKNLEYIERFCGALVPENSINFRKAMRDRKILVITLPWEDYEDKSAFTIGKALTELLSVSATKEFCQEQKEPFLTILSGCEHLFRSGERMCFFAARMCYARAPVSFGFAGYDSLVEAYSYNGRGQALFINCGTTIQTVDTVPPKEPGGLQRPIVKYLQSGGKVSEEIELICVI